MKYFILIAVITISGCAATYKPPTEKDTNYSAIHNSSIAEVFANSKKTLILEGFQIQSSDISAGLISTKSKNLKLSPEEANCGTTMGIDYLKDNRTETVVAVSVVVDANNLIISSIIQGVYWPETYGSYLAERVNQNVILTCVSKGLLEQQLGKKILNSSAES